MRVGFAQTTKSTIKNHDPLPSWRLGMAWYHLQDMTIKLGLKPFKVLSPHMKVMRVGILIDSTYRGASMRFSANVQKMTFVGMLIGYLSKKCNSVLC